MSDQDWWNSSPPMRTQFSIMVIIMLTIMFVWSAVCVF
jgi:hypothetical protein